MGEKKKFDVFQRYLEIEQRDRWTTICVCIFFFVLVSSIVFYLFFGLGDECRANYFEDSSSYGARRFCNSVPALAVYLAFGIGAGIVSLFTRRRD